MKILYISQYFPPEAGATQTRAFENVKYLKTKGHDVTVLCEIPNHPAGIVFKGYKRNLYKKEVLQGITVLYVRVFTFQKKNFFTRLAFYFSFMAGAFAGGMFLNRRFDLVYATSPPLPAAGAGLWLSLCKKIPFYFEVRDLWPDSAVALGELANLFAIEMARKLEHICYAKAKKVIAVTSGIEKALKFEKKVAGHKVALVPNGATTDSFYRDEAKGKKVKSELGLESKFTVLYAGILGVAQNLETLLFAAYKLRHCNDIYFLVAGAGPRKDSLEAMAEELGLVNLDFIGERKRSAMPELYSAVDAALVPLAKKDIFKHARPSKLFDAWACETPVLLGIEGEAAKLLSQCTGGMAYLPDDPEDLAEKVKDLKKLSRTDQRKMGKNARQYVQQHHSRQVYAKLLEKLIVNSSF